MMHTRQQSTDWGSMLSGVLFGAVIGAFAALLYAPKPGKELRHAVAQHLDEAKTKIDEFAKNAAENAYSQLAETKADLGQAVEAGRIAARERADALRRHIGI